MENKEKQVHVRIPDEVYKKLKVTCVYKDVSMQDYVSKLIAESLPEYSVGEQAGAEGAPKRTIRRR